MEKARRFIPWFVAVAATGSFVVWLVNSPRQTLSLRVPGTDRPAQNSALPKETGNPALRGRVITGNGQAANLTGSWSGFRGPDRTSINTDQTRLARRWGELGPRKLWSIEVGGGYAGAAIWEGRVFVMDYDREKKEEALRSLSLADGREIWRYAYPHSLKRDHGVTRTVPAVGPEYAVAIGPKGHVICVETVSGKLRWALDLVKDFGATIPPWYTGQCPLVDGDRVIIAPGGPGALLIAVELATGKVLWRTPNPRDWKMTHSSIAPGVVSGNRIYTYCAKSGVVGISARDGSLLWESPDWKISIATVPSPVDLGGGRIFLTGGYNAGSLLLQLKEEGNRVVPEISYRLKPEVFGTTQHSPIFYQGHLFGVRADGRFVCLHPDGKVIWTSNSGSNFGLGPFLIADGLIFVLNDTGVLSVMEATPEAYRPVAQARVLDGPESWGPMALVAGRLIVRDLHTMVCLDVAEH